MKRLLVLSIVALFVMSPFFVQSVSAEPLESFAENPIPYWEDDSSDVALTWGETEQTVTFEWVNDSIYWEDMTTVTDWAEFGETWESGESISTDGDICTFSAEGDAPNDFDGMSTTGLSLESAPKFEIRYRMSSIAADYHQVYVFWAASNAIKTLPESTTWTTEIIEDDDWNIPLVYPITEILVYGRCDDTVDVDLEIAYIRIYVGAGELDIAVPVTPQSIQSIELMGNFSALDSTVRFEMYDNSTASGLWCDVNSTHVTFPDASYAQFTNVARINFSLDEEQILFRIYVYAQNTTLINSYSDYVGLANKDYMRMSDSAFNGSFELWYLQGDVGYLEEVEDVTNIFYQLFLSTELYGYFGPLALVVAGFIITKKEKGLGIFFIIVDSLVTAQYLSLIHI